MTELRPYQLEVLLRIGAAWREGRRAPLIVAPTGAGKTVIAAEIIRRSVVHGWRVLFLAPRRELIEQAHDKLTAAGLEVSVVMAGDGRRNDWARVTVASFDTLHARRMPDGGYRVLDPDLIVVDEAHLFVTPLRSGLLMHWPQARLVGLTATPARKDGRALGMVFDELIEVASVAQLTADGFLVPGRYYSLSDPDLSKVRTTAGEWNARDLANAMDRPQLVGDVVSTWLARAGGRRTVVFASSIAHSAGLAKAFGAHGVAAEHVDANTPAAARAAIFDRFRRGDTQVLANCTLASYGFDLPELDCVVLARPTKSLVLYLQMLGRGLRPAPGKAYCLVLDHAGVVRRFGFADEPREWSLEGRVRDWRDEPQRGGRDSSPDPKLRECPECKALFIGRQCAECGWYVKPRCEQIESIDGELVAINDIPASDREKLRFFLQLRGEFEILGKRSGAAANSYRQKFGEFPPWKWNELPAMRPGDEVKRWVRSRMIAYAKRKRLV